MEAVEQLQKDMRDLFKKPHKTWIVWLILLIISILTTVENSIGTECPSTGVGYVWGTIYFIITIVVLAIMVLFMRKRKGITELQTKFTETIPTSATWNLQMFKFIQSSDTKLYVYFVFMAIVTAILGSILGVTSIMSVPCSTVITEKEVNISKIYTGSMVAAVVSAIIFAFIIFYQYNNFYGTYEIKDVQNIRRLIAAVQGKDLQAKTKLHAKSGTWYSLPAETNVAT